jgi:hypothetical protein
VSELVNLEHDHHLYLDLLKKTLTGYIYRDPSIPTAWSPVSVYDETRRLGGRDWPLSAHTMVGLKRLDSLHRMIEQVLRDNVPGDLIETGVWRGGTCIFMRGVLKAYDVRDRVVWVADSFQGFPEPTREDDQALASQPDQSILAVSEQTVRDNFKRYDLLDKQVQFIPGFFAQSLPGPVDQLAILRLDGDLYESTMDSLNALYPLLQPGGYCIIDDWSIEMARDAVMHYRTKHHIHSTIHNIDDLSVYWRKS